MKKTLLFLLAAMLLAALAGCPQNDSGENGTNTAPPPEEVTEPNAAPEEQSPAVQDEQQPAATPEPRDEQQFDALEIDMEKGTLYIRAGDAFSYAREDGGQAEYEITDNTLRISQLQEHKTVLTLPKDAAYTSLRLTVGEGHVYAESALMLQTLELNVTRGEVTFSAVSVADSSTVEVGQGSAFLHGDLGDSVTAQSKEGHVSMEVSAAQSDYNFEIDVSTGNIHLGTENYHGLSVSKSIDNGADRSMALSCTRGDLSVEFNK